MNSTFGASDFAKLVSPILEFQRVSISTFAGEVNKPSTYPLALLGGGDYVIMAPLGGHRF